MDNNLDINNLLTINSHNKEFIKFIEENKINNKQLQENIALIEKYLFSYNLCKKKENINKCQQDIKGYRFKLSYQKNHITLVLTDCLHRINKKDQKDANNNFLIRHYNEDSLHLTFKDFIIEGDVRNTLADYFPKLIKNAKNNPTGLYLYGPSSVGKTFIFILFANKLVEKKETTCFVSWPRFVSEVKQNIRSENNYNNKIEQLKKCEYLFIDDLGNETISAWERDELLFSILDSRVSHLNNKTTFINSNFSLKDLQTCYSLDYNSKFDAIKVNRLIERIKKLTTPFLLTIKF